MNPKNSINNNSNPVFPNQLCNGKYTLLQQIENEHFKFLLAKYVNTVSKQTVIAKLCLHTLNNKLKKDFSNEVNTYKFFNKQASGALYVKIPTMIELIDTEVGAIILLEYIDGNDLNIQNSSDINYLKIIFGYLSQLYINSDENTKNIFNKKNKLEFFLAIPFLLAKYVFMYPDKYVRALFLLKQFLESSRYILQSNSYSFVHRDLNPANILLNSDNIPCVLDYQLFCVSLASHDVGNAIYRNWTPHNSAILEHFLVNTGSKQLFNEYKFMVLYAALFDLVMGTGNKKSDIFIFLDRMKTIYARK